MSQLSLDDLPLEHLGLETRTCSILRATGARTAFDVIALGPQDVAARARAWSDLSRNLRRFEERLSSAESSKVRNFLTEGDELLAERARQSIPEEAPDLPEPLLQVYGRLKSTVHPVATRQLIRNFQLKPAECERLNSAPFITYPFGLHRWVGLQSWQLEGYRKAARSAWNILPLHLQRLKMKEEELPPLAWQAIHEVAQERNHAELFITAHLALLQLADQPETARPPEQPPEPQPELLRPEEKAPELQPFEPGPQRPEPALSREKPAQEYQAPPRPKVFKEKLSVELREALERSQPDVFRGVDIDDTQGAVATMLERVRKLGLRRPYSLAQLNPSIGDFSWLTRWAKNLTYSDVITLMESTNALKEVADNEYWSGPDCLGALLLFLCCEVGRREAREGEIWPVIPGNFTSATRSELFAGEQPRAATRQAIEGAARRLEVRHAFGSEGSQAWYQTAYLQFGFTANGLQSLPVWLSQMEHASTAVYSLYGESQTFRELWECLQQYRRQKISRNQAEEIVRQNPFALSTLTSEILEAAQSHTDGIVEFTEEGEIPPLLPTFHWAAEGGPMVQLRWSGLNKLPFSDSAYEVFCQDQRVARLVLTENGLVSHPEILELKLRSPYLTVELEGDEGDEQELDLVLWNTDQDVILFHPESGEKLPLDRLLNPKRPLLLLLAPGLRLEPSADRTHTLPGGETLCSLSSGWPETSVVSEQGLPVHELLTRPAPDWIARCELDTSTKTSVQFWDTVSIYLSNLPPNARIVSARAFGQTVEFSKSLNTWDALVRVEPALKSSSLSVRFVVECEGRKHSFQRSAKIPVHDIALQKRADEEWRTFRNLGSLSAWELKNARTRFFLQPDIANFALMGGASLLGRPPRRAAALDLKGGLGERLELWDGPYNRSVEPICLCKDYTDSGVALEVDYRLDGRFELRLHRAIEPGPDHFLLFWNEEGEIRTLLPDEFEVRGTSWRGELPGFGRELCLSVGFQDQRLGTAFTQGFQPPWPLPEANRMAGLMRWTEWPMLQESHLPSVRKFAAARPQHCLDAWVFQRTVNGVGAKLSFKDTDEWLGAVREVFYGLEIAASVQREMWEQLRASHPTLTPSELLYQLLLAVPLLALEMLALLTLKQQQNLFGGLLRCDANNPHLKKKLEALRKDAADDMGRVDELFVDSLVKAVQKEREGKYRDNLKVALTRPLFIRFMTASIIFESFQNQRVGTPS